jgi:hypothetical protein
VRFESVVLLTCDGVPSDLRDKFLPPSINLSVLPPTEKSCGLHQHEQVLSRVYLMMKAAAGSFGKLYIW